MKEAKVFGKEGSRARRPAQPFFMGLPALLTLALLGSGGCDRSSPTSQADDSTAVASDASRPSAPRVAVENPTIRIETSAGDITLTLDGVHAPGTVRNFLNYVNAGFYDNTLVHYVDAGKMIVAGGYGQDGLLKSGHISIRNEAHNGLRNERGTIAMARDPLQIDSATSQFFINLTDAPQRDHAGDTPDQYGYCVFGRVIEGLSVADKISSSPTVDRGGDLAQTPEPAIMIKAVRVVP